MAVATRTRADVDRQRRIDDRWGATQDLLVTRMGAVLAAQKALRAREAGAIYALRGALVDLAAASEALAGDLARTKR